MSPVRLSRPFLLVGLVAVMAAALAAQQLRQNLETLQRGPARIEKVREGLYVVRGPFVPCTTRGCRPNGPDDGLVHEPGDVAVRVTPAGLILVDNKYPENVDEVLQRVKSVSALPIKYMLNTHSHGDHVSGNGRIQEMGIPIVAHRNIRENILRMKAPGPPDIVFEDQGAVYLGGVEVKMHHFGRGHTNGDTVIEFPDLKAIHCGDLIIDGMPVIDYTSGGSALEFTKTIDRMLQLDFDVMIPGHGHVMTRQEAVDYNARFKAFNARAQDLVRRGVPKAQFADAMKLADFGWDHSVSTTASLGSFDTYYDEIAASVR